MKSYLRFSKPTILNRKNFLKWTASSSTALMLSSMEAFAIPLKPHEPMNTGFELKIMATNWGFPGSLDEYCAKVKKEGYDGIEIWWPLEKKSQDELFTALKKHQLELGFLCAGFDANFQKHFSQFTEMIDAAATQNIQRPLYINCHSGRDYFSYEQNKSFIDHTIQLSEKTGLIICHETHRSRMLFAAPVGRQFIEKVPDYV
jgi:sugar phosphate isomerase/epimerase